MSPGNAILTVERRQLPYRAIVAELTSPSAVPIVSKT